MKPALSPKPAPTPPLPAGVEQLDACLSALVAEHERLLAVTGEHRAALAGADLRALNDCIRRQNDIVQRISEIEQRRRSAATMLIGQPRPGDPELTIAQVSSRVPEPGRSRLASLTARLRDLLNQIHREHQALRIAAQELSNHMEGLMRQVYGTLSHSGTYGRGGAVAAGAQVVSALDVRT
jgi:hypothetical protein